MQDLGPNVHGKREEADQDTDDVDNVVPIARELAGAAAVDAQLLVPLHGAGKGRRDKGGLEEGGVDFARGRVADGLGKVVDEAEDKEFGKGSSQVGDAGLISVSFGFGNDSNESKGFG